MNLLIYMTKIASLRTTKELINETFLCSTKNETWIFPQKMHSLKYSVENADDWKQQMRETKKIVCIKTIAPKVGILRTNITAMFRRKVWNNFAWIFFENQPKKKTKLQTNKRRTNFIIIKCNFCLILLLCKLYL